MNLKKQLGIKEEAKSLDHLKWRHLSFTAYFLEWVLDMGLYQRVKIESKTKVEIKCYLCFL